jgi:hypothetical protein
LLGSISPYLEFQSTLEYLKNPPPGYLLPGTDLIKGIDELYLKVQNGSYSNEYDFQTEIGNLFMSGHDGHLAYSSDIVSDVMGISRSFDLLSISEDGQQLPKVYMESECSIIILFYSRLLTNKVTWVYLLRIRASPHQQLLLSTDKRSFHSSKNCLCSTTFRTRTHFTTTFLPS